MNTVRSFWLGWGSVCLAGGGAYYFAKRQINADRQIKMEEHRRKKQMQQSMEYTANITPSDQSSSPPSPRMSNTADGNANGGPARTDSVGSPSQEASTDPAPTRHAPATEGQRVTEKSKYESTTPYRARKGDRFS